MIVFLILFADFLLSLQIQEDLSRFLVNCDSLFINLFTFFVWSELL